MLGLISIIVNGYDNTVSFAKQGKHCCIGGEMPCSIKNYSNPTLLNPELNVLLNEPQRVKF